MLFDLRGRGRRRTVQAIYLMLAVLMGGGLVFFGIGGNTSGGLFDALGLRSGDSSGAGADVFARQTKQAEKQLKLNPNDAAAWGTLARVRFQQASAGGKYYDQQTGQFTDDGRKRLQGVAQAWDRYVALSRKPDDTLAQMMVQAFEALNDAARGAQAAEIVSNAKPTAIAYFTFARFAYAAKQKRKADLAAAEALRRASPDQREAFKTQLDEVKKKAAGGAGAGAASTTSATGQ